MVGTSPPAAGCRCWFEAGALSVGVLASQTWGGIPKGRGRREPVSVHIAEGTVYFKNFLPRAPPLVLVHDDLGRF